MKSIFLKTLLIFIILFSTITLSYSSPLIYDISGDISHKNKIVIEGASFSLKNVGPPIRYDNFEGGDVGTAVQGYSTSGPTILYSNEKTRYSGAQSVLQNFTSFYSQYLRMNTSHFGPDLKTMYFSGWFNMETGGAPSRNTKILNMGAGTGWQTRVDVYPTTGGGHMYASTLCAGGGSAIQDWSVTTAKALKDDGEWHRLEGWLDLGTPSGGGYRNLVMDGVQIGEISGTFIDGDCGLTYLLFGHYFARDTGTPTPWAKRFWDEIYVDSTRARVELCANPSWASKGACEIQVPSQWLTTSITAAVNTGAFATGQTAYFYVVDADGNVNSNGYPIVIGESQVGSSSPSSSLSTYYVDAFLWATSSFTVNRADGYANLTIYRTDGSYGATSVQWSSDDQTAVHGVDYYGADNVTVNFAEGETSKQISIQLIQNGSVEDRYFDIHLTNPASGATPNSPTTTRVTITGSTVILPPPSLKLY